VPDLNLDCNDCPAPVATPKSNTTYTVNATDAFGCIASGDITVMVTCNNNNFFIPNTFSPNKDGVNDFFYPRGTGLVTIQSLKIFNRWGEPVFEKKNFSPNNATAGWDGNFKGKPAVPDVYIYSIEIICENSQMIPFRGNVMLLR
jgi:gliding motility-associated-like protein